MKSIYDIIGKNYNKIRSEINVGEKHYHTIGKFVKTLFANSNLDDEYSFNVLDAGCGNGYLSKEISSQMESISQKKQYAFDISSDMVANSLKLNPDVIHSVCALPNTEFIEKQFDLIVMSEVLEHLYEPYKSLMEIRRILKNSGNLIITVPNGDRIGMDIVIKHKKRFQPADDYFYTFSELSHLFHKSGFRICEYIGFGGTFPILSKYSKIKKLSLLLCNYLIKIHPDYNRFQKQFLLLLRKDDYLLACDF
jgi:SAM-dependent methyltransferase